MGRAPRDQGTDYISFITTVHYVCSSRSVRNCR